MAVNEELLHKIAKHKLAHNLTWAQVADHYKEQGVTPEGIKSQWLRYLKANPEYSLDYEKVRDSKVNYLRAHRETGYDFNEGDYGDSDEINDFIEEANHESYDLTQEILASLTPQEKIGHPDDVAYWEEVQENLPDEYRMVFASDIHIPDQDERALRLTYEILKDFPHHVRFSGNDLFDLATVSRWKTDPRAKNVDILKHLTNPGYQRISKEFASVSNYTWTGKNGKKYPVARPFLVGNHDLRVHSFMVDVPQLRETVHETFVNMVRSTGDLWLGLGYENQIFRAQDSLLFLMHGESTATHAAATNLAKKRMSVISGHTHRHQTATFTSPVGVQVSHSVGCLCKLTPSYAKGLQNWQQGIGLITVNRKSGKIHIENLLYQDYSVVWGGKEYRA